MNVSSASESLYDYFQPLHVKQKNKTNCRGNTWQADLVKGEPGRREDGPGRAELGDRTVGGQSLAGALLSGSERSRGGRGDGTSALGLVLQCQQVAAANTGDRTHPSLTSSWGQGVRM